MKSRKSTAEAVITPVSYTKHIVLALIGVLAYVGALFAATIGELP